MSTLTCVESEGDEWISNSIASGALIEMDDDPSPPVSIHKSVVTTLELALATKGVAYIPCMRIGITRILMQWIQTLPVATSPNTRINTIIRWYHRNGMRARSDCDELMDLMSRQFECEMFTTAVPTIHAHNVKIRFPNSASVDWSRLYDLYSLISIHENSSDKIVDCRTGYRQYSKSMSSK